jgi:hypothetical protein
MSFPQLLNRHLLNRHLLNRHLLNRHLLNRQLLNRQLLNRHLFNRQLLNRQLLNRQLFILSIWALRRYASAACSALAVRSALRAGRCASTLRMPSAMASLKAIEYVWILGFEGKTSYFLMSLL